MPLHKEGPRPVATEARAEVNGQADHHEGNTAGYPDTLTPTAEAAEAALLGALLVNVEARDGIATLVGPGSFLRDAHRVVFVAVMDLHNAGQPVDTLTVTDRLATTGQLDGVGGPLGITDLTDMQTCPNPASWACYGTIVAREACRRRGIATLNKALQRLHDGEDPALIAAELAVAT